MTTEKSKAIEEADARLAAAEKRLKQAKNNRTLVLARERKAEKTKRDRGMILLSAGREFCGKNNPGRQKAMLEENRKDMEYAYKGRNDRDHAAVMEYLDWLEQQFAATAKPTSNNSVPVSTDNKEVSRREQIPE